MKIIVGEMKFHGYVMMMYVVNTLSTHNESPAIIQIDASHDIIAIFTFIY